MKRVLALLVCVVLLATLFNGVTPAKTHSFWSKLKSGISKFGSAIKTAEKKTANAIESKFKEVVKDVKKDVKVVETAAAKVVKAVENAVDPINNDPAVKGTFEDNIAITLANNAYQPKVNSITDGTLEDAKDWSLIYETNDGNGAIVSKVWVNEYQKIVVVAYKGTSDFANVKTDVLGQVKTAWNFDSHHGRISCGKVGLGFIREFNDDIARIESSIKSYLTNTQTAYRILITGHSLGAAVAHYGAVYFAASYPETAHNQLLITFASPKPGDADFGKCFNKYIKSVPHRFVDRWIKVIRVNGKYDEDIVTTVPIGYEHVSAATYVPCRSAAPLILKDLNCHQLTSYRQGISE